MSAELRWALMGPNHDPTKAATAEDLWRIADELEEMLINNEMNFRHHEWADVDKLRSLAIAMGFTPAPAPEAP